MYQETKDRPVFLRVWTALAASVLMTLIMTGTVHAAGSMIVQSCTINGNNVKVTASGNVASDDGMVYLFAEPVYSNGITTSPVTSVPVSGSVTFSCPLNARQADSKLCSKFVVAAKQGGVYVPVSNFSYITNPEAIASCTIARTNVGLKKGLLVDSAKLTSPEISDLGVKQAIYNIPLSNIIGPTTNPVYPTVNYSYNGKTYQFNGLVVAEYDNIFSTLTNKGCAVTAVLLGNSNGRAPQIIHPLARNGVSSHYYMLNAADAAGAEQLAATVSFLANRYSNKGIGKVDNWIVGNEITAKREWNYVNISDINAYVEEYAKAFRVIYNSIKSENANAKIYISIDQQWNRNRKDPNNFDGRDILDTLNANISGQGNIHWDVACHPYPVPLTHGAYWTGSARYKSMVQHSPDSPFLTMENIEVLTDYLCQPAFLALDGQVRSVICSEVGYALNQTQEIQAAAFTHAYMTAMNNQHIDAFILSRQTTSPEEIVLGLDYGLTNMDGSHKLIYDYYKNIDGPNSAEYQANAMAVMGITDWSQVMQAR